MVHHAVEAVSRLDRRNLLVVLALICGIALLGGCGGSSGSNKQARYVPPPGVGSVREANCTDWKEGNADKRHKTVDQLRHFAGGPVGSSAGIQTGPVLDDRRAYKVIQSFCTKYFARGFKLYKLYERAAAFVGRSRGPAVSPGT